MPTENKSQWSQGTHKQTNFAQNALGTTWLAWSWWMSILGKDNSFLLKGLIVISNTIPKIFTNIYVHNDTLIMKNSELIEHILYEIC